MGRSAHREAVRRPGFRTVVAVSAFSALVATALLFRATSAAFTTTTTTSASLSSGTVLLGTNSGGASLISASGMAPGQTTSGCVKVTYTGSLGAAVHFYDKTSQVGGKTGLAGSLDIVVTRGTISSGSYPACTGFVADATDWSGLGPGVLYSGHWSDLYDNTGDWLNSVVDPGSWSNGDTHGYRFDITLRSDAQDSAQGLSQPMKVVWEARNT